MMDGLTASYSFPFKSESYGSMFLMSTVRDTAYFEMPHVPNIAEKVSARESRPKQRVQRQQDGRDGGNRRCPSNHN